MEDDRIDHGDWGNNRTQHYGNCTDTRRRRLQKPWTKQRRKKKLIYKKAQERDEDSKDLKLDQ